MRISDWSSDVCSSDLCVGHAFAEAIFDQQIAPQQAEIAGYVIAEPFESGGNLFVQSQRVVAIGQLGQALGSIRPEKPPHRVIPRWPVVAAQELGVFTRLVVSDRHRHDPDGAQCHPIPSRTNNLTKETPDT